MIDWTSVGVKPKAEAERAVIGAILADADAIMPELEEMLSPEDFLISEYRTLFRTCSGYFVDGKPIDVVTLLAQHGDAYKVIMAEAIASIPALSTWKAYAQIVLDNARRYRAYESAEPLIEWLSSGRDVSECQQLAVRVCEHLSVSKPGSAVSAADGFAQFYAGLQKPKEYISTGFTALDRYTYIVPGDFVVIGARPSVGKTALTLQMLLHMSKTHRAAYFSLETRHNNLFGRMAANLSGVGLGSIKTQEGLDFTRLAQVSKLFCGLDFYTIEAAGWTVAQIKAKAVQLGAAIIFVDYIGLIKSAGKDRYEKMTNVSVDLHTMAQQSKITTIALSQFSRPESKSNPTTRPTIESLRESGQIEQDADVILLLHAPEGIESDRREISIGKNKEGRVGAIRLTFDGSIQRFAEMEHRYEE